MFSNIMKGVHALGFSVIMDDLEALKQEGLTREEQLKLIDRIMDDIKTIKSEQKNIKF